MFVVNGIVFRHNDIVWYAPLAGEFVCCGGIKPIQDPTGNFKTVGPSSVMLVNIEESVKQVKIVGNILVSVHLQDQSGVQVRAAVGEMIKNPEALDVLQQAIAGSRMKLGV